MKLIENLSQEKYEKFCRENKHNSHFLHSYVWGKFQEKERKVILLYYLLNLPFRDVSIAV